MRPLSLDPVTVWKADRFVQDVGSVPTEVVDRAIEDTGTVDGLIGDWCE